MPISPVNKNMDVDAEELNDLRAVSTRIGSDPLLVQAAGGNTSVKNNDKMLIKASGFWLADALAKDIFVPLDLPALRSAIKTGDPRADTATDFVVQNENPNALRPSIETCLHAIFDHKYVLHVHCVRTLSYAIRNNAEAELAAPLHGLDWVFVPYARPGA
ncbi:MAG: class II aldolase/adducin family protein, partial [Halocynthiibacter sp.]